jgi:transposase InsO family protein
MPWEESSAMSKRQEFVRRAALPGRNITALCREFGIARKTAYKWMGRAAEDPDDPLSNRSRRAKHSPQQTAAVVTEEILVLRRAHPYWGARKIHALLQQADPARSDLPAVSTINRILKRNQMISPEQSQAHQPPQRFERPAPNDLWQMDFKGYHYIGTDPVTRQKCYPLTLTDDHSRFALCLRACQRMTTEVVRAALIEVFSCYGLPEQMLMDNGPPWGCSVEWGHTPLTVWLLRLGIGVLHGRPYHPQTQGKEERFHRTLLLELLARGRFDTFSDTQQQYDDWRPRYNSVRPHEALAMATPASRYQPSRRAYPERLPAIVYDTRYEVRIVQAKGKISFRGKLWHIGRGFIGQPVALLAAEQEDVFDVYYCQHRVATVDLRPPQLILT